MAMVCMITVVVTVMNDDRNDDDDVDVSYKIVINNIREGGGR